MNTLTFRSEEIKVKNPYRWLPRKDEKEKKDRKKNNDKRPSSPSEVSNISKFNLKEKNSVLSK